MHSKMMTRKQKQNYWNKEEIVATEALRFGVKLEIRNYL